ncbi:M16 family metallopeptidase [Chitinilyticum piscinae]|uniref:Insulinase family protein n=1 Tax=Chitinilyticum piscinae TaxID=2866724 RepID=A0A8J7K9R8_9NEIS|nr:insulinase family protein [Chitinilyticum piscinae]MBE9608569.1 insulinase family protein [Chitinilyticum piscinae]
MAELLGKHTAAWRLGNAFHCALLALGLLLSSSNASAADTDQSLREGTLANGLHYVIKRVEADPGITEFRLLVKAGSLDEQPNERGLAHFLEHMAFRNSRHFPDGLVIDYLNNQGMRWGQDSNAFTSQFETLYHFRARTADLDRSLLLLADWAGGIGITQAGVDAERKIVIDEWRMRQQAMHYWDTYLDSLFARRVMSEHNPAGQIGILETAKAEDIQGFYQRNYLAPRMTVIVVGDVDPELVSQQISTQFAAIPAGPAAAPRPALRDLQEQALFANYHEISRMNLPVVSWSWLERWDGVSTEQGRLRDMQRTAALAIVQRRLEAANTELRSYEQIFSGQDTAARPVQRWTLMATPKSRQAENTLQAILTEAERARRFGFTQSEVDEQLRIMTANQQAFARKPQGREEWATILVNEAMLGAMRWTPQQWLAHWEENQPKLTPASLQQALDELMTTPGQLAEVDSKGTANFGYINDNDVRRISKVVKEAKLEPQQLASTKAILLPTLPEPGHIVASTDVANGGIWTLDNGVQVLWQKPVKPAEDIGIALREPGSLLALPERLRVAGMALGHYYWENSPGAMPLNQFRDAMTGHDVQLQYTVWPDSSGFFGRANPADLETALQMLYLNLQPLAQDWAPYAKPIAALGQYNCGSAALGSRLASLAQPIWPWRCLRGEENTLWMGEVQQAQQALFGDPSRLRLVLTGVADPQATRPLVERYLGGLKLQAHRPVLQTIQPMPLNTNADERLLFSRGTEANVNWRIVTPQSVDSSDAYLLEALSGIVRERLLKVLRFENGQSYSVDSSYDLGSGQGAVLMFSYNGPPNQCPKMARETAQALNQLRSEGVTEAEVEASVQLSRKLVDERGNRPLEYARALSFHWLYGKNNHSLPPHPERILNKPALDQAAARWLQTESAFIALYGCNTDVPIDFATLWSAGAS